MAWDRATPHDYDHRWINLHGMVAFGVRPGEALRSPESEWPTTAEKVRTDYLADLTEIFDELDPRRPDHETRRA
ncbi:MAG: hypothetical protein L0K86_13395 [Actinomycetia bacterium]|nr:hypothetical protein [Actinomycetes bacterium]